jgi:hypothetical protein
MSLLGWAARSRCLPPGSWRSKEVRQALALPRMVVRLCRCLIRPTPPASQAPGRQDRCAPAFPARRTTA